jgi:hypothetical protein
VPDPALPPDRPSPARLIALLAVFALGGPLLAIFGPPILNGFEQAVGTQPTPPDRPRGVVASAHYFYGPAGEGDWWWGECRELGGARYACVVWDGVGRTIIAGSFEAVTTLANNGYTRRRPRLPNAGETLHVTGYSEADGELSLNHPHGWLVPEGWIFNPSAKTKVRLTSTRGSSLTEPIPMTDDDVRLTAELTKR